jgi:hypothetical protein
MIDWFPAHDIANELFGRRRLGDEGSQRLRGILQQSRADRTFSIDEASQRSFVDAEAPGSSSRTTENLDAMGKMPGQV